MRLTAKLAAILIGVSFTGLALADTQQSQRCVSAGGALNEWIVALGAEPSLAGVDTVGDWLIKQAGVRNPATHSGYKVFSVEAMAGLNPDVLVFTDGAKSGAPSLDTLLIKQNPVLAATRAARDGRLVEVDPTLLVGGLSPRLPSRAFYPEDRARHAKAPSSP